MAKCFDFASEAKHQITIEANSGATDDYGGTSDSWAGTGDNSGIVWASVKPASDFIRFQSENLQTRVSHVFVIRYQAGFADLKTTVRHRITLDGRLFDIRAIKNMDDCLQKYGKVYQIILADEAGPDV